MIPSPVFHHFYPSTVSTQESTKWEGNCLRGDFPAVFCVDVMLLMAKILGCIQIQLPLVLTLPGVDFPDSVIALAVLRSGIRNELLRVVFFDC